MLCSCLNDSFLSIFFLSFTLFHLGWKIQHSFFTSTSQHRCKCLPGFHQIVHQICNAQAQDPSLLPNHLLPHRALGSTMPTASPFTSPWMLVGAGWYYVVTYKRLQFQPSSRCGMWGFTHSPTQILDVLIKAEPNTPWQSQFWLPL